MAKVLLVAPVWSSAAKQLVLRQKAQDSEILIVTHKKFADQVEGLSHLSFFLSSYSILHVTRMIRLCLLHKVDVIHLVAEDERQLNYPMVSLSLLLLRAIPGLAFVLSTEQAPRKFFQAAWFDAVEVGEAAHIPPLRRQGVPAFGRSVLGLASRAKDVPDDFEERVSLNVKELVKHLAPYTCVFGDDVYFSDSATENIIWVRPMVNAQPFANMKKSNLFIALPETEWDVEYLVAHSQRGVLGLGLVTSDELLARAQQFAKYKKPIAINASQKRQFPFLCPEGESGWVVTPNQWGLWWAGVRANVTPSKKGFDLSQVVDESANQLSRMYLEAQKRASQRWVWQ